MKTCHTAERKMSSWARPNWCLMKDVGPGGKRIPRLAVLHGEADGEQLELDTHIWWSRVRGEAVAAVSTVPLASALRARGCSSALGAAG